MGFCLGTRGGGGLTCSFNIVTFWEEASEQAQGPGAWTSCWSLYQIRALQKIQPIS